MDSGITVLWRVTTRKCSVQECTGSLKASDGDASTAQMGDQVDLLGDRVDMAHKAVPLSQQLHKFTQLLFYLR